MSRPSIVRSAGTLPPASLQQRGQHVDLARHRVAGCAGGDLAGPAGDGWLADAAFPGRRLAARSGPATPPSLPWIRQGPLSLVKMTSVRSSSFSSRSTSSIRSVLQSTSSTQSP